MFIERLLQLINDRGITKSKVLTDLNLGKNSFVNWQERNTIPSGDVVAKIAEYFNVSTDYILGKTDIKKEPSPELEEKAIALGQYLLDKGIVPDLSDESLSVVLDVLKANTDIIRKILDNKK